MTFECWEVNPEFFSVGLVLVGLSQPRDSGAATKVNTVVAAADPFPATAVAAVAPAAAFS